MKSFLFPILLITTAFASAQDIEELNRRNGFKSLKLGSSIDSVKGAVFKKDLKEKDEFPARLYEVDNPDLKNIGEVDVKEVKVMTYQNLIYKIVVRTDKDARVMRALEKSFGKSKYVVRSTNYIWGSPLISLTFHANRNNLELTYRCLPVIRKMYADKNQKVNDIADDF